MTCGGFWQIPDWNLESVLGFSWDMAKAAVPAGVAWVAYKVSVEAKEATQAQRDIAANQYKISLYEIRKNSLSQLDHWISNHKKYDFEKNNDFNDLEKIISDIENTFPMKNISTNINSLISNIRSSDCRLPLANIVGSRSPVFRNIKGTPDDSYQRAGQMSLDALLEHLTEIMQHCRADLAVPSQPY